MSTTIEQVEIALLEDNAALPARSTILRLFAMHYEESLERARELVAVAESAPPAETFSDDIADFEALAAAAEESGLVEREAAPQPDAGPAPDGAELLTASDDLFGDAGHGLDDDPLAFLRQAADAEPSAAGGDESWGDDTATAPGEGAWDDAPEADAPTRTMAAFDLPEEGLGVDEDEAVEASEPAGDGATDPGEGDAPEGDEATVMMSAFDPDDDSEVRADDAGAGDDGAAPGDDPVSAEDAVSANDDAASVDDDAVSREDHTASAGDAEAPGADEAVTAEAAPAAEPTPEAKTVEADRPTRRSRRSRRKSTKKKPS